MGKFYYPIADFTPGNLDFSRFGAAKQFQKVPPAEQNFESLQKDGQTSRAFNSSRH